MKTGRTPIITYYRRKHRRLNGGKLTGAPEGSTIDSCQERVGKTTVFEAEALGNKRGRTVISRTSFCLGIGKRS